MAKKLLKVDGRYTYYFDTVSNSYFYIDSGGGNYSSSAWTYKPVKDANEIKKLEEEFNRQAENTERLSRMQTPLGNPKIEPKGVYGADQVGTSLRYPMDMRIELDSHYVCFDFYKYKPPFQRADVPQEGDSAFIMNRTLKLYNASGGSQEYFKVKKMPQILMYMPSDIQDTFKAGWEGKAFGSTAAGMLAAAGAKSGTDKLRTFANTAKNTAEKLPVNAAASIVTSLIKNVTGDSISQQDVFGGIAGVVRNPNVELLFQQHDLRTFDLTFKMAPYSKEESFICETIINTFKKAMLPSYDGEGGEVFGIKGDAIAAGFVAVPLVCRVAYMKGNEINTNLPRYKMCAITDFNVNFTPDNNYSTLVDGRPTAFEIKINFMETKLLYAEDIASGF